MKLINLICITALFIITLGCQPTTESTSPDVRQTYTNDWKFRAGEGNDSLWHTIAYKDNDWLNVKSNVLLNEQNVQLDNGFGWYRKTISLDSTMQHAIAEKDAIVLHLGQLAACDEVYFNGKLIGKTGDFPHNYMGYNDQERRYTVYSKDINLEGENLIAIKFHNGWGVGGFLNGAQLSIVSAASKDKLILEVEVKDEDYIFEGDNPLEIDVNIRNNNLWDVDATLVCSLTTDDFIPISSDSIKVTLKSQTNMQRKLTHPNLSAGFYRYSVKLLRNEEQIAIKKINVGYEPEKIDSPLDAKADFRAFWDSSLKELSKVAPNYKLTHQPQYSEQDYDTYLVEMYSFQNELIRGYYAMPKRKGKHPVLVEYMGYGSQPYPPNQHWDGFAYFVLSIRGQGLNESTNKYGTWITHGLDRKENYYYRGAFLDVVRALDFVASRPELDENKIAVRGGSQGGALSFVAAALDKRVKAAAPNIPFLSDWQDYFRIVHWPKSDFDVYMQNNPNAKWNDVCDVLSYFDIKNLAQFIECPLLMGIGVQDEVCPPHINFAAYNQVRSEKRWMAFPIHGHSVGSEFHHEMMLFFKEKLKVE